MHIFKSKENILIVFVGLMSLIQLVMTNITYDESYYWVYSHFLDFGFYDHPPMVAVYIWLGELFGHGVFYTRFFFLVSMLVSLKLMAQMVDKDNLLLLCSCFLCFPLLISSGFLALPDTPLLMFSILLWKKTEDYLKEDNYKNVVLISLIISFLFYSKYHGLLIVIFTLLGAPQLLKRKSFYLIICLVVALYLPHIYWQYKHDFISFEFHLTGRREKHFDLENITNYLLGIIFVCGFISFPLLFKKAIHNKKYKIYFFNSIAFFSFVFLMSFRNAIELNWIVTASAAFLILALKEKIENKKWIYVTLVPSFVILFVFRVLLINDFGLRKKIDRLNEIHGWEDRFSEFYKQPMLKNVVFDNYQYGARFSYYKDFIYPVKHLRSRESHYSILNLTNKYGIKETDEITFVGTKNTFESYRIETNYKDPIYIKDITTISDIMNNYE